jgi:hypothetical protein
MDYPLTRTQRTPFPWRTAAIVAAFVAGIELLLLLVVGGALLAKPTAEAGAPAKKAAVQKATAAAPAKAAKAEKGKPAPAVAAKKIAAADLPRRKVSVLVLNGNGRTGAAAAAATRVGGRGYRISAVSNAPRQDYPQSMVLYRRGFEGEGHRLAKDLGVKVVGPLDGMKASQLHGAHAVFILGA